MTGYYDKAKEEIDKIMDILERPELLLKWALEISDSQWSTIRTMIQTITYQALKT